jgi:hypothetical protein
MTKIEPFEDIKAWQRARELVRGIYETARLITGFIGIEISFVTGRIIEGQKGDRLLFLTFQHPSSVFPFV